MIPATSQSGGPLDRIGASIEYICRELELAQIVKEKSIEIAKLVAPENASNKEGIDVAEPVANAVGSAIVSMAHEEAWKKRLVPKHLPDRVIGKLYGFSSSTVVYNKHLINSVITKRKVEIQRNSPQSVRTLR